VKWNFQKYLVGHRGKVIAMFGPREDPMGEKAVKAIDAALKKRGPFKPRAPKKGRKKKDKPAKKAAEKVDS